MPRGKTRRTFLFSDLHIDRWNLDKRNLFFSFMDHVEEKATEVFVLGDILDFPALEGNSIWPHHSNVIHRLHSLPGKGIPLTYIVGNHDIALRGIEIDSNDFKLTYADGIPLDRNLHGKDVRLEHGHTHDPLFKDHIYDAIDFLRELTGKDVDRRLVDFFGNFLKTFKPANSREKDSKETTVGVPENFLRLWETAAEQLIKRVRCDIVFFGHTHSPDIIEMQGGGWYVNTGDWVSHSSYVEMTSKGLALMEWPSPNPVSEIQF